MFGVVGIMIAIPVAAIIDYIYKEYFLYRMEEKKNIEHQAFDTYKDKSITLLKDIKDIKDKKNELDAKREAKKEAKREAKKESKTEKTAKAKNITEESAKAKNELDNDKN